MLKVVKSRINSFIKCRVLKSVGCIKSVIEGLGSKYRDSMPLNAYTCLIY